MIRKLATMLEHADKDELCGAIDDTYCPTRDCRICPFFSEDSKKELIKELNKID